MLPVAIVVTSIGLLLTIFGVAQTVRGTGRAKRTAALRWIGYGAGLAFVGVAIIVIAVAVDDLGVVAIVVAGLVILMGIGTALAGARMSREIEDS